MAAHRYRWGAIAWLLTLQFFLVETIAQGRLPVPYSRARDAVSALGSSSSPAHLLMNASLVVQGVLIAAGLVLLGPALLGAGRRAAQVLLGLAAVGVAAMGLIPRDAVNGVHVAGVVLYLACGGLGLIALAYALRPRSEVAGTALAVLGLVATAMTVFFVTGVTSYLGTGGTQRVAAYALPLGLTLAGLAVWRLAGEGPADDAAADRGSQRRQRREAERAERARTAQERDAALEAAAARHAVAPAGTPSPAHPGDGLHPGDPDRNDLDRNDLDRNDMYPDGVYPDDLEPEDPWATPPRRRTE